MECKRYLFVIAVLLFASVFVMPVNAAEYLEIVFNKSVGAGDADVYAIELGANKSGAVMAKLTTPLGVYDCIPAGEGWLPEAVFWTDHAGLTFSEFETVIAGDWTLVWDEMLGTETVAEIEYGTVTEGEFPEVPAITQPADGAVGVDPNTSIDWDYGGTDPCVAYEDRVEVCHWEVFPVISCADVDSCNVVSWTPPAPLADGDHFVRVTNSVDVREVASGIGTVTGDPWILENVEWLALQGMDQVAFEVGPSATEAMSFGRVKSLYR